MDINTSFDHQDTSDNQTDDRQSSSDSDDSDIIFISSSKPPIQIYSDSEDELNEDINDQDIILPSPWLTKREKVWYTPDVSVLEFANVSDFITAISRKPPQPQCTAPDSVLNISFSPLEIVHHYMTTRSGLPSESFIQYIRTISGLVSTDPQASLCLTFPLPIKLSSLHKLLNIPHTLINTRIPIILTRTLAEIPVIQTLQDNQERYTAVIISDMQLAPICFLPPWINTVSNIHVMDVPPARDLCILNTLDVHGIYPPVQCHLDLWRYDQQALALFDTTPSSATVPDSKSTIGYQYPSRWKSIHERHDFLASVLVMLLTRTQNQAPFVIMVCPFHHTLHNLGPVIESRLRMVLNVETVEEFMFLHHFLASWCTN